MDKPESGEFIEVVYGRGRMPKRFRPHSQLRRARAVPDIAQVLSERRLENRSDVATGNEIGAAVREAIGHRQQHVRRLAVSQRALLGRENRWPVGAQDNETNGQRHC